MNKASVFLGVVVVGGVLGLAANELLDAVAVGDFARAKQVAKKNSSPKKATEFVEYLCTKSGLEHFVWKFNKAQRDEILKITLPRVPADKRERVQKVITEEEARKAALKKTAERVESEQEKQRAAAEIDTELDPLIEAIGKNDIAQVKELLNSGIRLNIAGAKWPPPLLWAIHFGYTDIVKLLLEAGADPNFMPRESSIIANLACMKHDISTEILQLLLDHGMRRDLFLEPRVLECAARNGHASILKFIRTLAPAED